jgi:hypothetical protein
MGGDMSYIIQPSPSRMVSKILFGWTVYLSLHGFFVNTEVFNVST